MSALTARWSRNTKATSSPRRSRPRSRSVLRRENRHPEQLAAKAKKAQLGKDGEVALAGYCPVSLLQERKLVPGKPDLTLVHEGRVFRFASEAEREAFRRKPRLLCPGQRRSMPRQPGWSEATSILETPRWGVVYSGHLFLFKDETERNRFGQGPGALCQCLTRWTA